MSEREKNLIEKPIIILGSARSNGNTAEAAKLVINKIHIVLFGIQHFLINVY